MFTGIVTHCAPVLETTIRDSVLRLAVGVKPGFVAGLVRGASISVDGVCLTVVTWSDERFLDVLGQRIEFDCIDETLRRTQLGALEVGQRVNLERAARFGDEIGGHLLSGHIHCTARVVKVEKDGANRNLELSIPDAWKTYVIEKGYIAVNGCSLTVGRVQDGTFFLHLIPETLRVTNLSTLVVGDLVNVEIDHQTLVIVNTVERVLAQRQNSSG